MEHSSFAENKTESGLLDFFSHDRRSSNYICFCETRGLIINKHDGKDRQNAKKIHQQSFYLFYKVYV